MPRTAGTNSNLTTSNFCLTFSVYARVAAVPYKQLAIADARMIFRFGWSTIKTGRLNKKGASESKLPVTNTKIFSESQF